MPDGDRDGLVDVSDLREGGILHARFGDDDVVLVRNQGKLCALSAKCTHLGAPLETGLQIGGQLRCPWHHARFDVATGEAVAAPALMPLSRFAVEEVDGKARLIGKLAGAASTAPARNPGRVVIVGAGAAGYACAEMYARHGMTSNVTLLSADANAPYDRTFCSKQYLSGAAKRDAASLTMTGGAGANVTVTEASAIHIARDERAVVTARGERFSFDMLILATGATANDPDFAGADRPGVHTLRTLDDADALIAAAERARSAVIVGASFIALEAAASLVTRGLSVTVVGRGGVPLERIAGPEMGSMIRSLHEEHGVLFKMGRRVATWDGAAVELDDGSRVDADLVLVGIGASPRLELARAAGLSVAASDLGGGVAVDAFLRTSDPSIYAIGDIASFPDPRLGRSIRVEHWVVAQRMGQWLARHSMGLVDGSYAEVPFFWSGHYKSSLRYVGHVSSPADRKIDGSVTDRNVAVTFQEAGVDRALLTCGRDVQALETEAEWEGSLGPGG